MEMGQGTQSMPGGQGGTIGGGIQQTGYVQGSTGGQGTGYVQGSTGGQGTGPIDVKLDQGISDQMRVALHDFTQAANVCEWCAERCADHGPEMAECLRLCRDVADLASLNARMITRDSVFGPELAEVFVVAADACAQECAQHPHSHCQECAEVLPRAVQSVQQMLGSFEQVQGQFQPQGSATVGQF